MNAQMPVYCGFCGALNIVDANPACAVACGRCAYVLTVFGHVRPVPNALAGPAVEGEGRSAPPEWWDIPEPDAFDTPPAK